MRTSHSPRISLRRVATRLIGTGLVLVILVLIVWTNLGTHVLLEMGVFRFFAHDVTSEDSEGNLFRGITFKNVEIRDSDLLPNGAVVQIQELFVRVSGWGLDGLHVWIDHGRVTLPETGGIVLVSGSMSQGVCDINVYTPGLDLDDIVRFLPEEARHIRGSLDQADLYIQGPLYSLRLTGDALVRMFSAQGFTFREGAATVDLTVTGIGQRGRDVSGTVEVRDGIVHGAKTAEILVREGAMTFGGLDAKPQIKGRGAAEVERVKIYITLRGTLDAPVVELFSDPPMPQERLAVALATNRLWRGAEGAVATGAISPDLMKDFVDYFILGGAGSAFGRRYGISDVTVVHDNTTRGVGFATGLSNRLEARYVFEQTSSGEPGAAFSESRQVIGGEYKISGSLSLEAEQELKGRRAEDAPEGQERGARRFLLKYKRDF